MRRPIIYPSGKIIAHDSRCTPNKHNIHISSYKY